jgi:hypothetical protein
MSPSTQFLMLLRRFPTDLHGQVKTLRIIRKLAAPIPRAAK